MIVDALILAGGRSTRLENADKHRLLIDGDTLVRRAVAVTRHAGARMVVVVGDGETVGAVTVREHPAFSGPVAAIAAGFRALPGSADAILVIACDMPMIARALPALLDGFDGDGTIAVDRGRRQHLAILVRPVALATAIEALATVIDASMRSLLGTLELVDIVVPDGSTDDIDSWDDAARFGIAPPATGAPHGGI